MNSDDKKKKKKPTPYALILVVLAVLFNIAADADALSIGIFAVFAVIFAVVTAAVIIAKKLLGAKSGERSTTSPGKAAAPQREAALHFDSSKERSEGKYAAYDHDTAHRLEQLDSFLKNGIIDKKEYRLLKERYLRGGKEAN